MIKKLNIKIAFAIVVILFLNVSYSQGAKGTEVSVNGKPVKFDAGTGRPNIVNSRTMVPLRVISEDLGYKVDWSAKERKAIVQDNGTKVELAVGSSYALVNGKKTPIDRRDNGEVVETKSYIESQRTYVPLRFVSEALGAKVEYSKVNGNHVIKITTGAQKPVDSKNGYIGEAINTVGQDGYLTLETDGKSMGNGWVEPVFRVGMYDKTPNGPIRIFVKNPDDFDDSVRFDSKIIGKYEHYNTGTMDDWFDGGRMTFGDKLTDKKRHGDVFSLVIPKSYNAIDAKGKPLNIDTVKGQTIEIEIIARYKGMSKRYVIPAKL